MKAKRLTVTKDSVARVVRSIAELVGKQVLVGFPEKTTEREDEAAPMTNATLGYIHEHGSPAANIPARPFLVKGIEAETKTELFYLRKAADAALRGDMAKAEANLTDAGIIAEMGAKDALTNGDFEPLKPATIRARRYARGTASMRVSERHYLELIGQGMSPADAQTAAGIRPLINTGQLRNAITHVVRKK
jgi:hypothetical protein